MRDADGREPATPAEWQDAVDASNALLVLNTALTHRLVAGGPKVRVARAEDLLRRGRALGYRPDRSAVETMARGYAAAGDEDDLALIALKVHDGLLDPVATPPEANPRARETP